MGFDGRALSLGLVQCHARFKAAEHGDDAAIGAHVFEDERLEEIGFPAW